MTASQLGKNHRLSDIQAQAANWDEGAALVLAGSGSGKTSVLTARIARILQNTPESRFRVLALTYTNRAGDEMRDRVQNVVPDLVDRTVIGTFHSFCTRLLRLHGSHLGFKPDFRIYGHKLDREDLLREAIRAEGKRSSEVSQDDVRWLETIDRFRRNLESPEDVERKNINQYMGKHVARIYRIYENALRENNTMDFDGLILNTHRLVAALPSLAGRIQRSYPYWLIDEFQDTTPAQFKLVCSLAQGGFKNIFAVADDDQIIYQWAGAGYQQMLEFRRIFSPRLIQFVENYRCPADVVKAANNLVSHNFQRMGASVALAAVREKSGTSITKRHYATDSQEIDAIANTLIGRPKARGKTAILSRWKLLLDPVKERLDEAGVKSILVGRRDSFLSPQFAWLESCLHLCVRQLNGHALTALVDAANRMARSDVYDDADAVRIEASATQTGYLEFWADHAVHSGDAVLVVLSQFAKRLIESRRSWREVVDEAVEWLPSADPIGAELERDVDEDRSAWRNAEREISREFGAQVELDDFLQHMALRSKEAPREPDAVCLSTIHGSKGLEFDNVWVMGVVDGILPSWQSLRSDAKPHQLEEERRNFFVAVTRTRKHLVLSYAGQYRGRTREPSRFLGELELRHPNS